MQESVTECKYCNKKTSKSCASCGANICYQHRTLCKNCNLHFCKECMQDIKCPKCKKIPKLAKNFEKSIIYFWPALAAVIIYLIGIITSNSTFAKFAILAVFVIYPFTFMLEHMRENK